MITERFSVFDGDRGMLVTAHDIEGRYTDSHLYYCVVCGKEIGWKTAYADGIKMPFTAIGGVCIHDKPASRWSGIPGGIPRFDLRRYRYPDLIIELQFRRELEYAESLICPTINSSVPSLSPESTSS